MARNIHRPLDFLNTSLIIRVDNLGYHHRAVLNFLEITDTFENLTIPFTEKLCLKAHNLAYSLMEFDYVSLPMDQKTPD